MVRLPLVYKDVKGNLARLIQIIKSGIPMPLSVIKTNVAIEFDNLVDFLICCTDHPKAVGKLLVQMVRIYLLLNL